jgi:hypothetical protein
MKMIDDRFALEEFEKRGRSTAASVELARLLQEAIAARLASGVALLAESVARELREQGHDLVEIDREVLPGGHVSVTFADCSQGRDRPHHRLRFDLDLVVSAGFPGYRDAVDDEPA